MDNLLEILVPLIFAAIYFFSNMVGKSKEDKNTPSSMPQRRGSNDEDADAAERQRRIQEEIRRKIMERRRASGDSQAQPAPVGQELRDRRREIEGQRETRHARKETREVVHGTRDVPPPIAIPTHREAERESVPPAFTWDESDNAYEDSMQAQLKQIEETKRQAEKLKKQAAEKRKALDEPSKSKHRTGGYFTGTVRASLQDPAAARVAFIYGEVLGQPISLRKGSGTVPGLN